MGRRRGFLDEVFSLANFDKYREDNRREVKSARGGLPVSLWDSYSAMANTHGGVIICGVKEKEDRRCDAEKLLQVIILKILEMICLL